MSKVAEPVFTISLEKGLADRHRMPIDQVISVLSSVKQMIADAASELQSDEGDGKPLDFGLEISSGLDGNAFRKGSLKAQIVITKNHAKGIRAAQRVLATIHDLSAVKKPPAREYSAEAELVTGRILNRLEKIAAIHEVSRSDAKFSVTVPKAFRVEPGIKKVKAATFSERGLQALYAFREPVFRESGVTIHGKLAELKDKSALEREEGHFWGQLLRENGELWRIQFKNSQTDSVRLLFKEQVEVTGEAHYFQSRTPKLIVKEIARDDERDYVKAFDDLYGLNKALYNAPLEIVLKRRYEPE
ncbi:MAG: hypothetical protein JNM66_19130 [Bryobacterales bacterium]|nr:hypothetical protein [Bryobacterales bacterium]